MVYSLLYADMAVAFGHGDAVNSLGFDADAGGNTLDAYYAELGGVAFDREGVRQLNTGSGGGISVDRGAALRARLRPPLGGSMPVRLLRRMGPGRHGRGS